MSSNSEISPYPLGESSQHKIVAKLPITYTEEEKKLIYDQDWDSPLPQEIKSYWMDTLETKFVVFCDKSEFSLYLLPHILKKECSRTLNFKNIGFNGYDPVFAFSSDE